MWNSSFAPNPVEEDDAAAATAPLFQMSSKRSYKYLSIVNYSICFNVKKVSSFLFKMSLASYKDQSIPINATDILLANKRRCKQVKQNIAPCCTTYNIK